MPSFFRRAGADLVRLLRSSSNPPVSPGAVQVFAKDDLGVAQLYARTENGAEYQLTPTGGAGGSQALFGSGADGVVVLPAGTTTLTRDMYYEDLTIPVGATLLPDGFRIFVRNLLTLNGVISRAGNSGGAGTAVAGGAGGVGHPNAGRTLGFSASGGIGGDNSGGAFTGGSIIGTGPPPPGTLGGGGAGGTGSVGGAPGGNVTSMAANNGGLRLPSWAIAGRASIASQQCNSGGGGGGGNGSASAFGGGGGAGGGYLVLCAAEIVGTGSVTVAGGPGGAGFAGAGATGGGGGGGGGVLVICIRNGLFPTRTAAGGTGGAAGGGGTAGTSGTAGQVIEFDINL